MVNILNEKGSLTYLTAFSYVLIHVKTDSP